MIDDQAMADVKTKIDQSDETMGLKFGTENWRIASC